MPVLHFLVFINLTVPTLTPVWVFHLFLTPNNRSAFRAGVSLNIHSFIHSVFRHFKTQLMPVLHFLVFINLTATNTHPSSLVFSV